MSEDKAAYPSDVADKVLVRMPEGMRDRLKDAAKANNRTMNAEIVARLQQSLISAFHASMSAPTGALKLGQPAQAEDQIKALTLRLAEHELDVLVLETESEGRLLDAYLAAMTALDAVQFNQLMGYEQPLEAEDLDEVQRIYQEAKEVLDEREDDAWDKHLEELQQAQKRVESLRATLQSRKPKRTSSPPQKIDTPAPPGSNSTVKRITRTPRPAISKSELTPAKPQKKSGA